MKKPLQTVFFCWGIAIFGGEKRKRQLFAISCRVGMDEHFLAAIEIS